MFQTRYFRIVVVEDEQTVEVCGALKVQTLWLWRDGERGIYCNFGEIYIYTHTHTHTKRRFEQDFLLLFCFVLLRKKKKMK